jgi:hypothetical protein
LILTTPRNETSLRHRVPNCWFQWNKFLFCLFIILSEALWEDCEWIFRPIRFHRIKHNSRHHPDLVVFISSSWRQCLSQWLFKRQPRHLWKCKLQSLGSKWCWVQGTGGRTWIKNSILLSWSWSFWWRGTWNCRGYRWWGWGFCSWGRPKWWIRFTWVRNWWRFFKWRFWVFWRNRFVNYRQLVRWEFRTRAVWSWLSKVIFVVNGRRFWGSSKMQYSMRWLFIIGPFCSWGWFLWDWCWVNQSWASWA